ncbi:hypothetical protein DSM3645_30151 [Blastopirellula marina DSM 3645]|uniref:Uncharacterized protein n=1 Tax=Blastopirellula marina DSM 3645 TaxID=314230 RepID=A3ZXA2_9BACT|nr:hypothetical protein DSM3645_30151 [Blastopirellula marina DSM 3645]
MNEKNSDELRDLAVQVERKNPIATFAPSAFIQGRIGMCGEFVQRKWTKLNSLTIQVNPRAVK